MRPIDADKLISEIKTECNPYGIPTIRCDDAHLIIEMIDKQPTVRHCQGDYYDKYLQDALKLIGEIMCRATVHDRRLTKDDMAYINYRIEELKQKDIYLWEDNNER